MRKLIYTVKKNDGTLFETASYSEATRDGNKIIRNNLIEISDISDEYKAKMRKHAEKVAEHLKYGGKLAMPKYPLNREK